MEVYTKINSLYKRYAFEGKDCPNKDWLKFKNKIILGDFSNIEAKYLFNCPWEAYSKIDGTNSKIAFFPSTQQIVVGGKSNKASSQHGQFEMLQEIGERIKPQLCEMFPKECARFVPEKGENNKVEYWDVTDYLGITTTSPNKEGQYGVWLKEVPIYIYGEYFGNGIQKCGSRYIKDGNAFRVFDIKQQGWWLPRDIRNSICESLELKTVPFLGIMSLKEIEDKVRNGFTTRFENAADATMIEEGIVARPTVALSDGSGNRIIVKVKHCDYVDYDNVIKDFTDEEFKEFNKWYYTNEEVKR